MTCSLELAFDHHARMYVYELRPDWYEEFLAICEEIASHLPVEEDEDDGTIGGYLLEQLSAWPNRRAGCFPI